MPRTLLLSTSLSIKDTHSQFIEHLEASGRQLDIREATDASLRLRDWDIWLYNELILFAPTIDGSYPAPRLTVSKIRQGKFVATLHNIQCTSVC